MNKNTIIIITASVAAALGAAAAIWFNRHTIKDRYELAQEKRRRNIRWFS